MCKAAFTSSVMPSMPVKRLASFSVVMMILGASIFANVSFKCMMSLEVKR